jgi:peptidoglycan/LPS O-acetylase OafA/YrhL
VTLTTTAPRATAYTQPVPYLPGLDGLRALAVIAVIVYHGNATWLQGGFLGVEVFFVISGYLITMLLLSEHRRNGTVGLKHFWFRRARRLLPAVFALLLAVTLVSVLFVREELTRLKGDLFAALTYTMNWHLILGGTSYFDQFQRPPLLRHLWSLAVEEQFYLLWPLALAGLLMLFRKRPDRLFITMLALALGSTVLMALLYHPADPSLVYYGTDTRIGGLMLGCCLALFWHPRQLQEGIPPVKPRAVAAAGILGTVGLALLCVLCTERGAFLYRGGFLLVDVATIAVIAAVAHPAVRFGRRLGIPLLVYIGVRSYSIYLWHWPVFALTRPGVDIGLGPGPVFVIRLVITFVLADLSYRLIETPARSGAIGRWMTGWRASTGSERARKSRRLFLVGALGVTSVLLLTGAVVSAKPKANEIEESLRAGQAAVATQSTAATQAAGTSAAVGSVPPIVAGDPGTASTLTPGAATPGLGTLPPIETTTTVVLPPIPVIAIGDSVMLGAAPKLLEALGGDTYVDAVVGRQYRDAADLLGAMKDQGRLGQGVVLHLGNNGPMSAATFRRVMDLLVDVPKVVVVNVRVTKPWEPDVNRVLAEQVPTYPNARLLDWWGESAMHGDWFYGDSTHLNPAGATAYALLVAAALGGDAAQPAATPAPTTAAETTVAATPPPVAETTAVATAPPAPASSAPPP